MANLDIIFSDSDSDSDRVLPLTFARIVRQQLLAERAQRAANPAWQQYAAVADAERAAHVRTYTPPAQSAQPAQPAPAPAQPAPAPKPQPVPDLAEGVNCIICMDSLVKEDWRVAVPCGHTFHTKCIEVSRRYDNRCPECRRDIRDLVRVYWGGKRKHKTSKRKRRRRKTKKSKRTNKRGGKRTLKRTNKRGRKSKRVNRTRK